VGRVQEEDVPGVQIVEEAGVDVLSRDVRSRRSQIAVDSLARLWIETDDLGPVVTVADGTTRELRRLARADL